METGGPTQHAGGSGVRLCPQLLKGALGQGLLADDVPTGHQPRPRANVRGEGKAQFPRGADPFARELLAGGGGTAELGIAQPSGVHVDIHRTDIHHRIGVRDGRHQALDGVLYIGDMSVNPLLATHHTEAPID